MNMIVSLQEARDDLGIDFEDDATDRKLVRLIKTADSYLEGSLGKDYPRSDPKAKELALLVISELFDDRGMTSKKESVARRLVEDFSLQMRLQMRQEGSA